MTLRRKTRIIVGTMFLGLIVILYFLSENILRSNGVSSASIYEQDVTIAYLMLMIVGGGLLFGIVTILLLEKQVLSRLTHLSSGIRNIGINSDKSNPKGVRYQ